MYSHAFPPYFPSKFVVSVSRVTDELYLPILNVVVVSFYSLALFLSTLKKKKFSLVGTHLYERR